MNPPASPEEHVPNSRFFPIAGIPIMAWLFAKIVVVFNYVNDPDKMGSESRFWALMWVVFAVGIGVSYLFMVAIAQRAAAVSLRALESPISASYLRRGTETNRLMLVVCRGCISKRLFCLYTLPKDILL